MIKKISVIFFIVICFTVFFSAGQVSAAVNQEQTNAENNNPNTPNTPNTNTIDRSDPAAVADYILAAIQHDDVDAFVSMFNETNKRKFLPLTAEKRREIAGYITEEKEHTGTVTHVSEIREAPSFLPKDSVVAKIRQADNDEVFVIVLTKEAYGYAFEDINSPSVDSYNKLKRIK